MAKNDVASWSTIANDNTDIAGTNIAEGCPPGGINNAIRTLMAQIKAGIGVTFGGTATANTWTATQTFRGTSQAIILRPPGPADLSIIRFQDDTGAPVGYFGLDSRNPNNLTFRRNTPGNIDIYSGPDGTVQVTAERINVPDTYWGTFSPTGQTAGKYLYTGGGIANLRSSTSVATSATHQQFANPNGYVGSVTTNGSTTSFNTSSDERLKRNFVDFDAGLILDAIDIYQYEWRAGGTVGYGPKAQELYTVFPDAVSPGSEGDNPGDETFFPWGYDASKLVPLLIREVQALRARVAALEP